jgi:hypothetical protein
MVNGNISKATSVTALPFKQLSQTVAQADTFTNFPTSLMSVGKPANDGTISIFTKDGVTVHKEEDIIMTCKGEPILIAVRDKQGGYRIPLVQQRGHWQPKHPSKHACRVLCEANSVYELPSTKQAITRMHAVYGYQVK